MGPARRSPLSMPTTIRTSPATWLLSTRNLVCPPRPASARSTPAARRRRAARGGRWRSALDVEWAHAIAPAADLVLVEAKSANDSDLMSAVDAARNLAGVSVVSMSWGTDEYSGELGYDSHFNTPAGHQGITFVAASGDNTAPGLWPAFSPNVLSVGGTTLSLANGSYGSETAWSDSGGGRQPVRTGTEFSTRRAVDRLA